MSTTTENIGKYAIVHPIAQGGFGQTILAEDSEGKRVVLKQFNPQQHNVGTQALRLFDQECDRLQDVGHHPQIPSFIEYFEEEGNRYIAQTFIPGQTLKDELQEAGVFSEDQTLALLKDILPVIKSVHEKNVIHRDIKPDNIIRQSVDGKLFLVDFGASKPVSDTVLAKTGTMIGSPLFVAPEQSRGKATYASDIYSLGLTCAHLLTNISPFDLVDEDDGKWVWQDYCTQIISEDLALIINTMLKRGLKDRYKSASEVLEALAALENQDKKEEHWIAKAFNKHQGEVELLNKESIDPWDQQEDEPDEWFNRFQIFLHMTSESRDVAVAYHRRNKTDTDYFLKEWIYYSSQFNWEARAKAYDAFRVSWPKPCTEKVRPLAGLRRPVVVLALTAVATTGIAVWRNAPVIWKEPPPAIIKDHPSDIEQPSEPKDEGGLFGPRVPILDDMRDELVASKDLPKESILLIDFMLITMSLMLCLLLVRNLWGILLKLRTGMIK